MEFIRRKAIQPALVALLLGCCLIVTAQAQEPPSHATPQTSAALPSSNTGQYAETDVCKTCHQEVWDKHFANTPHAALLKGDEHGCQGCHGPAQAHVDGGGDVTKIIRFENLNPAQTAAICTKCHQSSLETQNFSKSEHLASGVSCTNCHSPHGSKDVNFLLVKSQTELCYGCHATQKAEFARPYRHRVDVGSSSAATVTILMERRPAIRCAPLLANLLFVPSVTPTPWGRSSSSMLR
jgi:predicted CXXCH cytochrome family protein